MDFLVVNAFTTEPYEGNPVAIVPSAGSLDEEQMQAIAKQFNLPETVFVKPPQSAQADISLRFFTPERELEIASHPCIATWVALAYQGLISSSPDRSYRQQTSLGIHSVKYEDIFGEKRVVIEQPRPRFGATFDDYIAVAEAFDLKESDIVRELPLISITTGFTYLVVPLISLSALLNATRTQAKLLELCKSFQVDEVQLFSQETLYQENDVHSRNICPRDYIEDSGCGLGNAAIAAYLARFRDPKKDHVRYSVEQGFIVGLPSKIHTEVIKDKAGDLTILIGGSGTVMVTGSVLRLPKKALVL